MNSYSAYFVRNADLELVRLAFSLVKPLANSDWLMCAFQADAEPPEDAVLFGNASLTVAKSQALGEVLFIYGDTSCDGFVYEHAQQGELLRKLVWFPLLDDDWTAGWLCVEGVSEAWEAELFTERQLTQYLQETQDALEEAGQADKFASLAAKITLAWQNQQIVVGETYPRCDGTVTLLVEQYYGITR